MSEVSRELEKEKARRIFEWFKKEKSPPFKIELRITNRCNLHCIFCLQAKARHCHDEIKRELSKEKYLNIVVQAAKLGVKHCHLLGGGELMVRKDITLSIMRLVKKYGMYGSMVTNGTLFTDDDVQEIVKMEWDYITFSLDGADSETHDYLRGKKGAFKKTIETIKNFQKWKKILNMKKPKMVLNTVLTNKNYNKLIGILELAHKFEINDTVLLPLVFLTEECEHLKLNKNDEIKFKKSIPRLQQIAKRYGIVDNYRSLMDEEIIEKSFEVGEIIEKDMKKETNELLAMPCFSPYVYISVRPNGVVHPCPMTPDDNIENIREKNLKEIWYGKYFQHFRDTLRDGKLSPWCQRCCGANVLDTRNLRELCQNLINQDN